MKKLFLLSLAVASGALISFNSINELPIGSDLPKADVKLKDISGKEITLKQAAGKNGLLVMFSCNTCPYVVKNQKRTLDVCRYAQAQNIGVILVNSNEAQRQDDDSFDAMKEYAKEQGYAWYYVVDKNSEVADAFGANRTPENFLFDKEGKLVYHGAIDDNPSDPDHVKRSHLREALNDLVSGKEIAVKTSRSVGCNIKRL
ncbi:MAG: thioredoxin family protein [Flavisolibacter sp.]|jgi:peroxiredoxin